MDERRMPFSEHLRELRARLVICLLAIGCALVVGYWFCPDVFLPILCAPLDVIQGDASPNRFVRVIRTPLLDMMMRELQSTQGAESLTKADVQLHYLALPVGFMTRLMIGLLVGVLIALPVIAYEIWAFVSAGLRPSERRLVLIFGPMSFVLFLAGAALAYFIVLPVGIWFFISQGDAMGMTPVLTINQYAPLVLWTLFWFGAVFQMPLVAMFLAKLGVVNAKSLARGRRYAILGIFIVAAVITPTTDPFSQIALALPMMALYELSIFLAWMVGRKAARAA